jgi:hypothetical protein
MSVWIRAKLLHLEHEVVGSVQVLDILLSLCDFIDGTESLVSKGKFLIGPKWYTIVRIPFIVVSVACRSNISQGGDTSSDSSPGSDPHAREFILSSDDSTTVSISFKDTLMLELAALSPIFSCSTPADARVTHG